MKVYVIFKETWEYNYDTQNCNADAYGVFVDKAKADMAVQSLNKKEANGNKDCGCRYYLAEWETDKIGLISDNME